MVEALGLAGLGPSGGGWSVGTVPSSTAGSLPCIPLPEALLPRNQETLQRGQPALGTLRKSRLSFGGQLHLRRLLLDPLPDSAEITKWNLGSCGNPRLISS